MAASWNNSGVEGGIPTSLEVVRTIRPGDDIQAAVKEASRQGGGVVLLRSGTYNVDKPIDMESNVVVRGENRSKVVIVSSINIRRFDGALFHFAKDSNSGIENLTMTYNYDNRPPPDPHLYKHDPYGTGRRYASHVRIEANAENNWIVDTNMIDAGWRVVNIKGDHNTLTGNVVDGAHEKGGGGGYYLITGDHNLIQNETIKHIRHLAIQEGADHNVIVDNDIQTDVNFHHGDDGRNLLEGNNINPPRRHGWLAIGTGAERFGHNPPGPHNVIVNNRVNHGDPSRNVPADPDVIYTYNGFDENGGLGMLPDATNWSVPSGDGRFYDTGRSPFRR